LALASGLFFELISCEKEESIENDMINNTATKGNDILSLFIKSFIVPDAHDCKRPDG
jgi:hypothetical protein